jgi:FtsP/CotA-like multicopper oxidase with cupredoxin domain
MTPLLTPPLEPFVDALPVPRRLIAGGRRGRLTARISVGAHRFHPDLPESPIWGSDGTVPGPTIEAWRGQPVTVNMKDMGGDNVVTVQPGASQTLVYHFTQPGPLIIGCHEPGHYAAGMRADVTVG